MVLKIYFKTIFTLNSQLISVVLKIILKPYSLIVILKFYPKNIFGKCGFKIYLKTVFSKYGFRRENLVIRKEDSFNNNFLKNSIHFFKKK